jgi:hypothetical protein
MRARSSTTAQSPARAAHLPQGCGHVKRLAAMGRGGQAQRAREGEARPRPRPRRELTLPRLQPWLGGGSREFTRFARAYSSAVLRPDPCAGVPAPAERPSGRAGSCTPTAAARPRSNAASAASPASRWAGLGWAGLGFTRLTMLRIRTTTSGRSGVSACSFCLIRRGDSAARARAAFDG